jgi:vacuolar-type H+-ATPase subunit H
LGVVAKVEEIAAKVEEEGQKQYDKLLAVGQTVRGEQAANDNKVVLVAVGLVETLKVEADKLKIEAKTEADKFKAEAEKLKVEAQKLFSDLIAAGEKRKAA